MKINIDSNIQITALVPDHAESLYTLTNSNRAYLKQWLSWLDMVKTFKDTQMFIETAVYRHNHNEASTYAILYQSELVGIAGFNHFDYQHKWAAIGYWLSEEFTGQGIVSKVVQVLMDYGFTENKLNKIEIRCAEENYKSRAIAERLGFTYEATLRHCEWLYDHYVDHSVYTMLASEYQSK